MPQIPTIINQVPAKVGVPSSSATGQEFGADIGAAMQQLGSSIKSFGSAIGGLGKEQQARKDNLDFATAAAKDSFTATQNDMMTNWPDPAGQGLPEGIRDAKLKWIDDKVAENVKNGMSRKAADALRLHWLREVPGDVNQAANNASKMAAEHAALQSKDALDTQVNDVRLHGAVSQAEVQKRLDNGAQLIDAQLNLTATEKEGAKQRFGNDVANARFDAMRDAAKTPEDILALKQQLTEPYWAGLLSPAQADRQAQQLAQSAERWGELGIGTTADVHINAIRADPSKYTTEVKNGLDELIKVPGADPVQRQVDVAKYRSNAASVRFESIAEKLAEDPSAANRAGLVKLQEELKDPKWRQEFTSEQYNAQTNSLIGQLNALDTNAERQQRQADIKLAKQVTIDRGNYNATLDSLEGRSDKFLIPDSELRTLYTQKSALGGEVTPSEQAKYDKIITQQDTFRALNHQPPVVLEQARRAVTNGSATRFSRGPTGGLMYKTPNGVVVAAGIRDSTSIRGLQPKVYEILDAGANGADKLGVVRIQIVAGKGEGHLSHMFGTQVDVIGYQADGKFWTSEQRAGVARLMMQGGADRAGLYETGNHAHKLHIGYSGHGLPPAMWGAGGLTSGDASRAYADPANRALLADFQSGKLTGGGRPNPSPGMPGHVATGGGGGLKAWADLSAGDKAGLTRNYGADAEKRYEQMRQSQSVGGGAPASGGGGTPATGGAMQYANAIGTMETGGQASPYTTVVGSVGQGDPALGRYGVLRSNVGPWAKAAGLGNVTAQQFLASKDIQDKVFEYQFGEYVKKYGAENAAAAWFAGEKGMNNPNASDGNQTVAGYKSRFRELMGSGGGDAVAGGAAPGANVATGVTLQQSYQLDTIKSIQTAQDAALKIDPISYGRDAGVIQGSELNSPGGWDQRAKDYDAMVKTYGLSGGQRLPFTQPEAAAIGNIMAGTDVDARLAKFAEIARWPRQMQEDAYNQIGKFDAFSAAVGRMAGDGGIDLARSAMRGNASMKAMDSNKADPNWLKGSKDAFVDTMGDALRGMDPYIATAKKSVYDAIYADKRGVSGEFDQAAYEKVVEDVEGGKFGTVNGIRVLKPDGVTDQEFTMSLQHLPWTDVSKTNTPPLADNGRGKLMPAQGWALEEAKPVRTGDGVYAFLDENGEFFRTQLRDGSVTSYKAVLDAPTIRKAAVVAATSSTQRLTTMGAGSEMPTAQDFGRLGIDPADIPDVVPPTEPQTGHTPSKAIPRAIETQLKQSLDAYRGALKRNGVSEVDTETFGQEFIDSMRRNWYLQQGFKGD